MTLDEDCFEPHSYTLFKSPKLVQEASRNLKAIGIGSVSLAVQTTDLWYNQVVLGNIVHCFKIFTNLISTSSLHQNGFYVWKKNSQPNQKWYENISSFRKRCVVYGQHYLQTNHCWQSPAIFISHIMTLAAQTSQSIMYSPWVDFYLI